MLGLARIALTTFASIPGLVFAPPPSEFKRAQAGRHARSV